MQRAPESLGLMVQGSSEGLPPMPRQWHSAAAPLPLLKLLLRFWIIIARQRASGQSGAAFHSTPCSHAAGDVLATSSLIRVSCIKCVSELCQLRQRVQR